MAKQDRSETATKMRAAYRAGDVRGARTLALSAIREDDPAAKEAQRLLERTETDRRALAIGAAAFALGAFYLITFLLLG